jgi:hypothetical protein
MIELHEFALSGNCRKVRLLLSLLGLEYRSIRVDGADGEHKRPDFLRLNPLGQAPVLLDEGFVLPNGASAAAPSAIAWPPCPPCSNTSASGMPSPTTRSRA